MDNTDNQEIVVNPKKSKIFLFFAVFIALVLVGAGGYVLGNKNQSLSPSPTPKNITQNKFPLTTQQNIPSSSSAEIPNWNTYQNSSMGIQFQYPNDPKWNIKEKTQGENSLTVYNYDVDNAPGRSYSPKDGDLFKIEVGIQTSNINASQWFEQEKKTINPMTNNPNSYFNVKIITVDSKKGIYFEVKDELSSLTVGSAVFEAPNNKLVFFFGGLNFEANKETFDKILSTFKFTNTNTSPTPSPKLVNYTSDTCKISFSYFETFTPDETEINKTHSTGRLVFYKKIQSKSANTKSKDKVILDIYNNSQEMYIKNDLYNSELNLATGKNISWPNELVKTSNELVGDSQGIRAKGSMGRYYTSAIALNDLCNVVLVRVLRNNKVYEFRSEVSLNTSPQERQEYEDLLDQILSTFKFLD